MAVKRRIKIRFIIPINLEFTLVIITLVGSTYHKKQIS